MKYSPAYFPARHALSVGFAVLLAVFVNHYFAKSGGGWVILTTFLVSQTTRGTPLRQSIIFSFLIILAILLFSFDFNLLRYQMMEVSIGAIISIICNQFIFPIHFDVEFRQSLIPILKVLKEHPQTIPPLDYPEWVYEVGFNPGLRSGFRFFLVHIDWIIELFCSMNYLLARGEQSGLFQELSELIAITQQKNQELFDILIEFFQNNNFTEIHSDFTSDIVALETATRQIIPQQLELLDISADYVTLTAFVRDMKDLRTLLLQLVMAIAPQK
ncbi:MAG: hypothetical protein EPO11_01970 [Gammaproteobacteria bacterium]|nr:MAG: hypothetical protein EPO11_01970 [Gammaproteobacteria bacterium]